jgi:hypothetical protein
MDGEPSWQMAENLSAATQWPETQSLITSISQHLTLWHTTAISFVTFDRRQLPLTTNMFFSTLKNLVTLTDTRVQNYSQFQCEVNRWENTRLRKHWSAVTVRMEVSLCRWYNLHSTTRGNVTGGGGGRWKQEKGKSLSGQEHGFYIYYPSKEEEKSGST